MRISAKFALRVGLALASLQVFAADLAILRNGFSIRHERRESVVAGVTRLYTGNDKSEFVDIPTVEIDHYEKDLTPAPLPPAPKTAPVSQVAPAAQSPQKMAEMINDISNRQRLDPDFVNSVIHAESGFNPRAVSPKGARGLMQLMPQTASNLGVTNSFDPTANVDGGTRYLRELLERYNFDVVKALAAYNAGPQRVEQYGGVPPYYETRAYVARIVRDYNRKKLAEQKAQKAAEVARKKAQKPQPPAAPSTRLAQSSVQPPH
jgi:soluble lytic murein transglycosylase-like protein